MEKLKEKFEVIPGFRGRYLISNKGDVFCIPELRFIPQSLHDKGYLKVSLIKNGTHTRYFVHRLVMLTFVRKSKLQVNHKDGNKKNNSILNLEYVTPKQNIRHSFIKGFHHSGEKCTFSKLSLSQVNKIRKEYKSGKISQSKLAKKFGISQPTICDIMKGRTWRRHGNT